MLTCAKRVGLMGLLGSHRSPLSRCAVRSDLRTRSWSNLSVILCLNSATHIVGGPLFGHGHSSGILHRKDRKTVSQEHPEQPKDSEHPKGPLHPEHGMLVSEDLALERNGGSFELSYLHGKDLFPSLFAYEDSGTAESEWLVFAACLSFRRPGCGCAAHHSEYCACASWQAGC
jgi:hypothetical protein